MDQSRAYVCNYCAAVGVSMKYCAHCKSVSYCGTQCQRADWPRHQLVCSKAKSTKEPSQTTTTTQTNTQTQATPAAAAETKAPVETPSKQKSITVPEPEVPAADVAATEEKSSFMSPIALATAAVVGIVVAGAAVYTFFSGSGEEKKEVKSQAPRRRAPRQRN